MFRSGCCEERLIQRTSSTTPVGSPVHSSPKTPRSVTYSDRFIPSRAEGARLNFSVLEREKVAEATPQRDDREVVMVVYSK